MDVILTSVSDFIKVRLYDYFKSENAQYTTTSVVLCITLLNLLFSWMSKILTTRHIIVCYYYWFYYKIFTPQYDDKNKHDFQPFNSLIDSKAESFKVVHVYDTSFMV